MLCCTASLLVVAGAYRVDLSGDTLVLPFTNLIYLLTDLLLGGVL